MKLSGTSLFTENTAALASATTRQNLTKSKNIDIKFHYTKQLVFDEKIFDDHVLKA